MSKRIAIEIDTATGERIERNLTAIELQDLEQISIEGAEQMAQAEAKATEKVALLERLGITADEAKLLLS